MLIFSKSDVMANHKRLSKLKHPNIYESCCKMLLFVMLFCCVVELFTRSVVVKSSRVKKRIGILCEIFSHKNHWSGSLSVLMELNKRHRLRFSVFLPAIALGNFKLHTIASFDAVYRLAGWAQPSWAEIFFKQKKCNCLFCVKGLISASAMV